MSEQTIRLSQLYSILIDKRGKEEADAIVNYVEVKVDSEIQASSQPILSKIDKLSTELTGKSDKLNSEIKEYVERSLRQQLWAIIGLFIPLYLAIIGFFWAVFNVIKK